MPTRAENPKAINKMSAEMMVGQPAMLEAAWAPATPNPTPINPPMALRTTASTRNCRRMCRRLAPTAMRSEEHTSELQSRLHLVCRLLLEKKKINRESGNTNFVVHVIALPYKPL